jgi:hypothetical protein
LFALINYECPLTHDIFQVHRLDLQSASTSLSSDHSVFLIAVRTVIKASLIQQSCGLFQFIYFQAPFKVYLSQSEFISQMSFFYSQYPAKYLNIYFPIIFVFN